MVTEQGNLYDDPSILPHTKLWRRVKRDDPHQVKHNRPSSAAFKRHPANNAISINIVDIAMENGLSASDMARNEYLVLLTAEQVRSLGLGIAKTPQPDDPSHGDIFDMQDRSKTKFKEIQKALARNCEWEIGPAEGG